MNQPAPSLHPHEGWHVLHLFYSIDRSAWALLTSEERLQALTHLTQLLQDIRAHDRTQILTFAIVTPKADFGVMLLTLDLQDANDFEKKITVALGPGVLQPVYSYLSMTERSEYTTTSEQKAAELTAAGHPPESPEHRKEIAEFETRMKKYLSDRLYPNMSDWPVFCFYPMNKRREGADNWYSLDFDTRRKLMEGHARVGRGYAGKIRQLITGSTGLDEFEWFVTLQAKDTFDIKAIVYEMRFDEVSARFAEFGDFFIGLQLPLSEIFRRLCLHG
ncbi:MAG: hydrogen peroxide-dependent heme synthase [Verrucomicrobiales bacterium]